MARLRMLGFFLLVLTVSDRAFACESVEGLLGTYQVCRNPADFHAAARAAGVTDLGIETFESARLPVGLYGAGVFDPFYDEPFGARFVGWGYVDSTISVHQAVPWGKVLRGRTGFYGVGLAFGPIESFGYRPHARAIGFDLALEPIGPFTPTSVFVWLDHVFQVLLEPGFIGIVAPTPFESVIIDATNYGTMVIDNIEYPGGPSSAPDNPIPPGLCPPEFAWWCFDARMGPEWYDPTPTTGYEFRTLAGSFTAIDDFPPGFGDAFTVTVGGINLGTFAPGQRVEFPAGVTQFRITGITPAVDGDNPTAFPIKLSLDTVGATFVMAPLTPEEFDESPPVVTCDTADGFWHADNVSIACTASDDGSGLANAADATFTLLTTVASGAETDNALTGSRQVCDIAGNCASAGPIGGNRVDRKAPEIAISSPGAGPYVVGAAVSAHYSCIDDGSGLDSCGGSVTNGAPVDTSSAGTRAFIVMARDHAGNLSQSSVNYLVASGKTSHRLTGSGYNLPESPAHRADFVVNVAPGTGIVKYLYPHNRVSFVSSSVDSLITNGSSFTITGRGSVNAVSGYTFTATVGDGSPDSFGIVIQRADGTVLFSAASQALAGGAFTVLP